NAFWLTSVYNVNVSESVLELGGSYRQHVTAKYGDANVSWAPREILRLKSWGFNGIAEYSSNYTLPWATNPRWNKGEQPAKMQQFRSHCRRLGTASGMRATMRRGR